MLDKLQGTAEGLYAPVSVSFAYASWLQASWRNLKVVRLEHRDACLQNR